MSSDSVVTDNAIPSGSVEDDEQVSMPTAGTSGVPGEGDEPGFLECSNATPMTSDVGGDVCIDLTLDSSPLASVKSELSMDQDSSGLEEPLTPATDNSEKSGSVSGRITPGSQSDQSATFSSSEKSTPRKIQRHGDSTDMDNLSTSSGSVKSFSSKFPNRIGINWRKGERLEAMDYMQKWFPAKIREVNEQEHQVLIHFDGWNQRFDEWLDMTSGRIRPLIRHSGRKDRGNLLFKRDYKVGEQVYAKWTDCKMYPAKIIGHHQNGCYEVIFYDGFKKQVQPMNVRPVPGESKRKTIEVSPPPKDSLPRSKKKGFDIEAATDETSVILKRPVKSKGEYRKRPSTDSESGRPVKQKKAKHCQEVKLEPVGLKADGTEPGMSPMKSEPVSTQTDYLETLVSKPETSGVVEGVALPASLAPGPSVELATDTGVVSEQGTGTAHSSGTSADCQLMHSLSAVKHKTVSVPKPYVPPVIPRKAFVVESDHNRYKCHYEGCNKGFRKEHLLEYHIKYYHIENEPAPTTPQPPKKRRKTISIGSPEGESSRSSKKGTKKKHRHLSESYLLTDVKSPVKDEPTDDSHLPHVQSVTPVKQETGEISTQTTPTKYMDHGGLDDYPVTIKQEVKSEVKHQRTTSQDSYLTEESSVTDAEEFLKPDELVNCICDFYEENGLMIQCEVCLCWQHASCFGITDRTLPKTYVCFVCENPPGVRDSSRYVHEQDWFKTGEMAAFSYLDSRRHAPSRRSEVKATHNLITDLQRLNTVLDSLKLQLHILRNKDVDKLKLWKVDWDIMKQETHSNAVENVQDATEEKVDGVEDTTETGDKQYAYTVKMETTESESQQITEVGPGSVEIDDQNSGVVKDEVEETADKDVERVDAEDTEIKMDVDDTGHTDTAENDNGSLQVKDDTVEGEYDEDFELKLELTDEEDDEEKIKPECSESKVPAEMGMEKGVEKASLQRDDAGSKEKEIGDTVRSESEGPLGAVDDGNKVEEPGKTDEKEEAEQVKVSESVQDPHRQSQEKNTGSELADSEHVADVLPKVEGTQSDATQSTSLENKQASQSTDMENKEVKQSASKEFKEGTMSTSMEKTDLQGNQSCSGKTVETPVYQSAMVEGPKVDAEEGSQSDSTESVPEDPLEVCERNLLSHILRVQAAINERFDLIEEQVTYLEALEASNIGREPRPSSTVLSDVPQLKRSIRAMEGDLCKIRKMSVFH